MDMKIYKKLALLLLASAPPTETEEILEDYMEFSKEKDFNVNFKEIRSSLDINYKEMLKVIVVVVLYIGLPLYVLADLSIININMRPFSTGYYFNNILFWIFPVIVMILWGEKLIIIDKYNNFKGSGLKLGIGSCILLTTILIIVVSMPWWIFGDFSIRELPMEDVANIGWIQFYWSMFDILVKGVFVLCVIFLVQMFMCGISFFKLFFHTYLSMICLLNSLKLFANMEDIAIMNRSLFIIIVQYAIGILITYSSYHILCQKRRQNNESSI